MNKLPPPPPLPQPLPPPPPLPTIPTCFALSETQKKAFLDWALQFREKSASAFTFSFTTTDFLTIVVVQHVNGAELNLTEMGSAIKGLLNAGK